jgi:hypothetical protein
VQNQSFDRLMERTRSDLLFTHFHDHPNKYRGQIVSLEMNVRRVLPPDDPNDPPLHEVWGFTDESRDRLYVAMVVDYPKDMPVGPKVNEKAKFVGYFLKLQGYQAFGAKPNAVPDKSPLLIGRLEWIRPVAVVQPTDTTQEWIWGLPILGIIAVVFLLRLVYQRLTHRKQAVRHEAIDHATGEVIPIDAWLERAGLEVSDAETSDIASAKAFRGNGHDEGLARREIDGLPDTPDEGREDGR